MEEQSNVYAIDGLKEALTMIECELQQEKKITPVLLYQYLDNSQSLQPQKIFEKISAKDKS